MSDLGHAQFGFFIMRRHHLMLCPAHSTPHVLLEVRKIRNIFLNSQEVLIKVMISFAMILEFSWVCLPYYATSCGQFTNGGAKKRYALRMRQLSDKETCLLSKLPPSACLSSEIFVEGDLKNRSVVKVSSLKCIKGKREVTSWPNEAKSSTLGSNCLSPFRQNIRPLSLKVSSPLRQNLRQNI